MKNKFKFIVIFSFLGIMVPFLAATQSGNAGDLIFQLQQQTAELQTKVQQLTQSSPVPVFTRGLYLGLRDGNTSGEVTLLQRFLASQPDLYPEGLVTGYFGPLTERAVQRFQAKYGVVSLGSPATTGYGVWGPQTRATYNDTFGFIIESGPGGSGGQGAGETGTTSETGQNNVSITVLSPNGGEELVLGELYSIDYKLNNVPSGYFVDIWLGNLSNPLQNKPIATNIRTSVGEISGIPWRVSQDLPTVKNNYKISATLYALNPFFGTKDSVPISSDESDTPFSIISGQEEEDTAGDEDDTTGEEGTTDFTVNVTSPNGGERWEVGKQYNILWAPRAFPQGGTAAISLFLNGQPVRTLRSFNEQETSALEGNFRLSVPDVVSPGQTRNGFKIEVSYHKSGTIEEFGRSNSTFSITNLQGSQPQSEPSVTITSPSVNTTWRQGTPHQLTWEYRNLPTSNIDIFRFNPDGSSVRIDTVQAFVNDAQTKTGGMNISVDNLQAGQTYAFKVCNLNLCDISGGVTVTLESTTPLPDYRISSANIDSAEVDKEVLLTILYTNSGSVSGPIPSVKAIYPSGTRFSRSGGNTCIGKQTIAPGEICTIEWYLYFSTAGTKIINLSIDNTNISQESNENNNDYSLTFNVSSTTLPAPTVSISASPTSITAGQSSTLSWSSENTEYCDTSWGNVRVGSSGSVSVSPTETTSYIITCYNNAGQSVVGEVPVTVSAQTSSLPDYVLENISIDPVSPTAGEEAVITTVYSNAGSVIASFTGVSVNHPSAKLLSGSNTCNDDVAPGAKCTSRITVIYENPGTYYISATVDAERGVKESNEFNNFSQWKGITVTSRTSASVIEALKTVLDQIEGILNNF